MSSAVANTLSVGGGVPPVGSSAAEFGHPTPRRTPLLVAMLFTLSVATSGIVLMMQGRALEELRAEISAIRVGAKAPETRQSITVTTGPAKPLGKQCGDMVVFDGPMELAHLTGADGHSRGRGSGGGGDHDVGFQGIAFVFVAVLVIAAAFALAAFAAVTSIKHVRKLEDHASALEVQRKELEALRSGTSTAQKDNKDLEPEVMRLMQQVEELATDLHAQKQAFEALRTETLQRQQEQATAVQVQNQAFEAMRVEMSSTKQEHTTAMEAQSKALQAQLNEVTRKHAATDMIAQLAAAHLAGDVPEVAKHIGGDKLNAALVELRGEDAQQRVDAARALSGLGGSSPAAGAAARHALVAALRGDAEDKVRMMAAEKLGLLPDATLVPHLTAALREDKNLKVRRYAAMSLGRVGAPAALTAVEALTSAMRTDPNEGVRAAAAGALLALDAQGLTSEAQGIALQVLRSGGHWVDRGCAAWSVGRGRGPEARAGLEKAAGGDAHEAVRAKAKKALETLRP